MFEDWPEGAGLWRIVDPPVPVAVDLATIFPRAPGAPFRRDEVTLKVKAGG